MAYTPFYTRDNVLEYSSTRDVAVFGKRHGFTNTIHQNPSIITNCLFTLMFWTPSLANRENLGKEERTRVSKHGRACSLSLSTTGTVNYMLA